MSTIRNEIGRICSSFFSFSMGKQLFTLLLIYVVAVIISIIVQICYYFTLFSYYSMQKC